jgi:hypothetical protein
MLAILARARPLVDTVLRRNQGDDALRGHLRRMKGRVTPRGASDVPRRSRGELRWYLEGDRRLALEPGLQGLGASERGDPSPSVSGLLARILCARMLRSGKWTSFQVGSQDGGGQGCDF